MGWKRWLSICLVVFVQVLVTYFFAEYAQLWMVNLTSGSQLRSNNSSTTGWPYGLDDDGPGSLDDGDQETRWLWATGGGTSTQTSNDGGSTAPPKRKNSPSTPSPQSAGRKGPPRERIDLMIVVPSYWSETTRRSHVRDSWMHYFDPKSACTICHRFKVVVKFMVGRAIYKESEETIKKFHEEVEQYNDMVVLPDFEETAFFKQRSQKTLACIRYAWEKYDFAMLLKADTDSYVFADRLLARLEKLGALPDEPRKGTFYLGNFQEGANAKVVTTKDNPKNKWADDTFTTYTGLKYYPMHAKGAGYLVSAKLASFLAHPPLPFWPFTCEDTAIGAYLLPLNVTRVSLPVAIFDKGCLKPENMVVDHYVPEKEMLARMERFKKTGNACSKG